jgi:hypothetical protein
MRKAIEAAVERLGVIPFFPSEGPARLEVMRVLEDMIGTEIVFRSTPQQRLDWLITAAINAMRQWGGIPGLRGLLCSRWKPADGIEAYSTLPGYSGEDSESLALEEHRNRKVIEAEERKPIEAAKLRTKLLEIAEGHRTLDAPTVIETTVAQKRSVADDERELAEAPKRYLSEAEKARRLAELEASLERRTPCR